MVFDALKNSPLDIHAHVAHISRVKLPAVIKAPAFTLFKTWNVKINAVVKHHSKWKGNIAFSMAHIIRPLILYLAMWISAVVKNTTFLYSAVANEWKQYHGIKTKMGCVMNLFGARTEQKWSIIVDVNIIFAFVICMLPIITWAVFGRFCCVGHPVASVFVNHSYITTTTTTANTTTNSTASWTQEQHHHKNQMKWSASR